MGICIDMGSVCWLCGRPSGQPWKATIRLWWLHGCMVPSLQATTHADAFWPIVVAGWPAARPAIAGHRSRVVPSMAGYASH